ncbi:hypothetical protein NQZ68_036703 [Dissostichus eleginoides]|nr:hypothetical protein NQZ68_036703 [Dissostichus eleginoides]
MRPRDWHSSDRGGSSPLCTGGLVGQVRGSLLLCRHTTISKFFGNKTPNCAGACDFCRNPKLVRAQLEKGSSLSTKTKAQSSQPSGPFGFLQGFYEGGKKGYGFERQEEVSDVCNIKFDEGEEGAESGEDDGSTRKKEFSNLYKKQMTMRKGMTVQREGFVPPDDDCQLRDASSHKIPRLTVKAREHCLSLLQEALYGHQRADDAFSDTVSLAVEIEHEVFKNSKSSNLYKAAVLKRVSEMKRTGPGGKGDDVKADSNSDSTENESKLKEEAPSSSSSFAEELQGFTSASEIYSMKRKRVGAGLRGSSDPFMTAKELLKPSASNSDSGGFHNDTSGGSRETNKELSLAVTSSIRTKAMAASLSSPTKGGRAASKKQQQQQKLAEAAKSSRNILQYFAKKDTPEKSQEEEGEEEEEEGEGEGEEEEEEEEVPDDATISHNTVEDDQEIDRPLVIVEQMEISSEEEVILISDNDEEEEIHQIETLEVKWFQYTPTEDTTTPAGQKETQEEDEPVLIEEVTGEVTSQKASSPPAKNCDPSERGLKETQEEEEPALTEEVVDEVTAQKASSPPAKRSRLSEKRVTFNPRVQERPLIPANQRPPLVTLKEAADIVVRYLDPFYSKGKFATKELFKSFARFLSHLLTEGSSKGKGQVKAEANTLINKFFIKVQHCKSEADWTHLRKLQ